MAKKNTMAITKDSQIFRRSLALVAQELCPIELFIEFNMAILEDRNPRLVRNKVTNTYSFEDAPKGSPGPSLEMKYQAMKFLKECGYGLPAQNHYIEAEIKSQVALSGSSVGNAVAQIPYELLLALRDAVGSTSTRTDVDIKALPERDEPVDAEFTEAEYTMEDED